MRLTEYQRLALSSDKTGVDEDKRLMVTLLGLAGETGSLLSEYKKWLREGDAYKPFKDQVTEELGDILWYLANLASKLNLDLDDIAQENIAKIEERWPKRDGSQVGLFGPSHHRYDAEFRSAEQLPAEMRIEFIEDITPTARLLRIKHEGQFIGDKLTDNSHYDDGYRYHDVFHMGCAVFLGWSPVMRRLLKCKRKSIPRVDEVEDGARAAVTEEGISAVVFNKATAYSLFERSTQVDYDLLRTVRAMAAPFEVRTRSLADWEHTILQSFVVWRQLIQHKGGVVIGNLNTSTLKFEPLAAQTD